MFKKNMSTVRKLQPDPEEGTLPKSQIYFTYLSVAFKADGQICLLPVETVRNSLRIPVAAHRQLWCVAVLKKKQLLPINKSLQCSSLLLFYCVLNATEFWWDRASMLISLEAATCVVVLWISPLSSSFSFPASVTAKRMLISFSQSWDRLKKTICAVAFQDGWARLQTRKFSKVLQG